MAGASRYLAPAITSTLLVMAGKDEKMTAVMAAAGLIVFGWAVFDSQTALEAYVARKHLSD
jgi:hypothetical protein